MKSFALLIAERSNNYTIRSSAKCAILYIQMLKKPRRSFRNILYYSDIT